MARAEKDSVDKKTLDAARAKLQTLEQESRKSTAEASLAAAEKGDDVAALSAAIAEAEAAAVDKKVPVLNTKLKLQLGQLQMCYLACMMYFALNT